MYITVIYLPKSNISTWLQFIYLAPIYLPGSNLSTWLQYIYLAPIYLPGSNAWFVFLAGAECITSRAACIFSTMYIQWEPENCRRGRRHYSNNFVNWCCQNSKSVTNNLLSNLSSYWVLSPNLKNFKFGLCLQFLCRL